MMKRLFYTMLSTMSVTLFGCGQRGESDYPILDQCGVFDHNAEKIVLSKQVFYDKSPEFPGGEDSLRCYLARNVRYDKVLDAEVRPSYLVCYIVNADCSITISDRLCCIEKDDDSPMLKYKRKEARRLVSTLKYERPYLKYDTLTGQWTPTAVERCERIYFNRNLGAELYDKDTILARMDRPYADCQDALVNRRFKQYTTEEEKIELCQGNHSWATKVNALVGLIESGNAAYKELLPLQLSDTTSAFITTECVSYEIYIADVVLAQIRENADRISALDNACVDSIVLYSAVPDGVGVLDLWERSILLSRMEPRPEYYERVRQVWLQDTIPGALALLAKYRKKQDFKLILEALNWSNLDDDYHYSLSQEALLAVSYWPDARFVPSIERMTNPKLPHLSWLDGRRLAYALLAYRNDWALDLMRCILQDDKGQYDWWSRLSLEEAILDYVENNPDDEFSSMFQIVVKPN